LDHYLKGQVVEFNQSRALLKQTFGTLGISTISYIIFNDEQFIEKCLFDTQEHHPDVEIAFFWELEAKGVRTTVYGLGGIDFASNFCSSLNSLTHVLLIKLCCPRGRVPKNDSLFGLYS